MDDRDYQKIANAVIDLFEERMEKRIVEKVSPVQEMALENTRTLKGSNGTIGLVGKHEKLEGNVKLINWLFGIIGVAVITDVVLRLFDVITTVPLP